MSSSVLTGKQRTQLRSLGQTMDPQLKLGNNGLTPAFLVEVENLLKKRDLIKLKIDAERDERAALCDQIAAKSGSECVGAVGRTALFYRAHPTKSSLPEAEAE